MQVNNPPNVVEAGNRIFLSRNFTPQTQYQNTLKKYYNADIAMVDFPSPLYAAQSINGWVNMVTHGQIPSLVEPGMYYTVQSKSFRTDFFKNRRHMRKTYTFFLIQNKLHWHIYRLLPTNTVSEKLPKIPLFGPSLIYQLRLLGSQQHPQIGVLLTSFSNWGTENSLAEINLESTEGDKGL